MFLLYFLRCSVSTEWNEAVLFRPSSPQDIFVQSFGFVLVKCTQAQLRNRLATDLLQAGQGEPSGDGAASKPSGKGQHASRVLGGGSAGKGQHPSIAHQIADALVQQHLETVGYEYTLSVFLAESGKQDEPVSMCLIAHGAEFPNLL